MAAGSAAAAEDTLGVLCLELALSPAHALQRVRDSGQRSPAHSCASYAWEWAHLGLAEGFLLKNRLSGGGAIVFFVYLDFTLFWAC